MDCGPSTMSFIAWTICTSFSITFELKNQMTGFNKYMWYNNNNKLKTALGIAI